jgi:ADP-ribosylglycohydrolase
LRRAAIFDQAPSALDVQRLRREERIEGMLLGIAVGDALGHSTEWTYEPERRRREFGTIVDHVGTAVSLPGRISDDTQFSFWTIESLLQTSEFDPEALARYFVERKSRVVGMGRNTARSLTRHADRLRDGKLRFYECVGDASVEGRGNGTVMRLAPLLLPHLRSPSPNLYADLAIGAFITHGHAAALAATVAMGHLLWQLLARQQGDAPAAEWWLDEYVRIAGQLEEPQPRYLPCPEPVPALWQRCDGSLAKFVDTRVRSAWRAKLPLHEAFSLKGFGSGADCLQSVPAILYTLMHHADDLSSAVIAAVNDTKDNDTVASVVAAFCGALHGRRAIRQKWIDGISSSSLKGPSESDRAIVERLTHEARARFLDGEKLSQQPKWLF